MNKQCNCQISATYFNKPGDHKTCVRSKIGTDREILTPNKASRAKSEVIK